MQFKRVGKRIQVLAYRGYDSDKKRAIVKMMGSLSDYVFSPSDGLMESLTADEQTELQSYIESERSRVESLNASYHARSCHRHIQDAASALNAGVPLSPEDASQIWAAIPELTRALRKAGHPRPAREPRPTAPDARQADLLADVLPEFDQPSPPASRGLLADIVIPGFFDKKPDA